MGKVENVTSDEAVEAAAKVEWLRLTSGNVAPTGRWEDQPDDYLDWLRNNARAMLEAAAPHLMRGDVEWTVFFASDGEHGSPAENLRYSTKAGAQESIDTRYGTPELWEPRRRIVGEWSK